VDSPQTKAFCIVIARNVAVDILIKSKKSVFVTEEELDFYESDAKNEEAALSNIGVERLKQALRRLPKEYYDVLMLNVKSGCSLSEM
ncbi:sigma-70 family RNA polymerase sigma factor, partial [[Eubacterium] siraeum]|nr:sigma-70 family RNA polymerase sigma factor [[Eubacterium] siraeum]